MTHDDGLDFVRGCLVATVILVPFWAMLVWALVRILGGW
jgi:hypothetical protein